MYYNYLLALKRPFIWLSRIHHRCGYGVHSPFAFNLITQVIYEKGAYYQYSSIPELIKKERAIHGAGWNDASTKVNKLLFRLLNRFQPQVIVSLGKPTSSDLYLRAAKVDSQLYSVDQVESFSEKNVHQVDFLYIHCAGCSNMVSQSFEQLLPLLAQHSVCVIKDIHRNRSMSACWKQLINNPQVGITFDLYDVGIMFFDTTKIKQHYRVNF